MLKASIPSADPCAKVYDCNMLLKKGFNTKYINYDRNLSAIDTMGYEYAIDDNFAEHFRSLHQVFMYITDRCNLECKQCIYKPSTKHFINEEISLDDALALLRTFYRLGARKVTFLGGEPTLYGYRQHGKPLLNLIEGTEKIGFEYIRLDTNGQMTSAFLPKPQFSKLNELSFSLDGFSPATNDQLRGRGTFIRVIDNLRLAIEQGYHVTITCCIHKLLLTRDRDGVLLIERMIRFAEEMGVHQINFHDLFKVGTPMDTWTGNFAPQPSDWLPVYDELYGKIVRKEFSISVRLPQCFIKKTAFDLNPEYYGYCPAKLGERVMVHPNGIVRICSNLICTGFGVARYDHGRITWDNSYNNEILGHDIETNTPCTNRSRHREYGDLVPVCFSFKPGQEEFVWREKIHWETK